jgi:hypothetical protein
MALLSCEDSTPRAYRLKVSNAALPFSTITGTSPLTDLPIGNRPGRIVVHARRFHYDAVLCGRRIFAERFEKNVLAPWARRTARLDHIVHCLGLALSGRPAASFARRLMLPVSNDTTRCCVSCDGGGARASLRRR